MLRQGMFSFPQSVITKWQTCKLVQRLYKYLFGGRLQGVLTKRTLVAAYRRFETTHLATRAIRAGSAKFVTETQQNNTVQYATTRIAAPQIKTRQHR